MGEWGRCVGIGLISVEVDPIIFELIGLGLRR